MDLGLERRRMKPATYKPKMIWKVLWPLVFISAMTLLSECGPRLGSFETAPQTAPFASGVPGHTLK